MQCLHAQTWVALALLVRGWLAFGYCALLLASLALLNAYPAAYRRHILQLAWLHHAILAISHHLVDMAGAVQFSPAAGTLAWLGHVCVLAGTNSGATVRLCGEALIEGFAMRLAVSPEGWLACQQRLRCRDSPPNATGWCQHGTHPPSPPCCLPSHPPRRRDKNHARPCNPCSQILLCFQLPPVATAVSACCMAAALASMNGSVCASAFMQVRGVVQIAKVHVHCCPCVPHMQPDIGPGVRVRTALHALACLVALCMPTSDNGPRHSYHLCSCRSRLGG